MIQITRALILIFVISIVACSIEPSSKKTTRNNQNYPNQPTGKQSLHGPKSTKKKLAYSILEGDSQFRSGLISVDIESDTNSVEINIRTELGADFEFPEVSNPNFSHMEDAKFLGIEYELTYDDDDDDDHALFSGKTKSSIFNGGSTNDIDLTPDHFKDLAIGKYSITLKVTSRYESFFGHVPSNETGIGFELNFEIEVFPIYESVIYFSSLVLNKLFTQNKLKGNNDFHNSRPETGISIRQGMESLIFDYAKNNYSFRKKIKKTFYHNEPNPTLTIVTLDVDHGFNFDDKLADTMIYLNDLISENYKTIGLTGTDDLQLYCTTKGQINK